MSIDLQRKLAILADAAKYDASCASSGTEKRDSTKGGIGSTEGSGICHSYAPDGRCISLLKVLLTNFCVYDCAYCINRSSSNVARARFSIEGVVALTLDFYRRNYIEGLFLSSGIIRSRTSFSLMRAMIPASRGSQMAAIVSMRVKSAVSAAVSPRRASAASVCASSQRSLIAGAP